MLWLPTASALVLQLAVLLLPLPTSATALHPAIALPPSVKATLPVGAHPLTVAVKVMLVPTVAGLSELASVVVLVTLLTTCASAVLAETVLVLSPP